ncbi:MAG: hypothetical protein AAF849_24995 [Bacteroidota bacterium]
MKRMKTLFERLFCYKGSLDTAKKYTKSKHKASPKAEEIYEAIRRKGRKDFKAKLKELHEEAIRNSQTKELV